jgi:hypothetical protein
MTARPSRDEPLPAAVNGPSPPGVAESDDISAAQELTALKRQIAAREVAETARYTGWKPLVLWYLAWDAIIAVGSVSALAQGQFGTFLFGVVVTVTLGYYVRYLFNGGRRRFWFIIF